MSRDNPAHLYRQVAKSIVEKMKMNLIETIDKGKAPDLYWKLEIAIADALREADTMGADRVRAQMNQIVSKFEAEDGTSQN